VLLGGVGLAAMAYAASGLLTDDGVHLVGVLEFLVALVVAHDLILMPVAIGVGVLVFRYVPAWARSSVQGGLFASAVVSAFALPFVIGAGRTPDNPSKLPLPYGLGLAIVLAVSWLAAAAFALWMRALWMRALRMRARRIGPAPDVVSGGGDCG
jgi:hypothetical protein